MPASAFSAERGKHILAAAIRAHNRPFVGVDMQKHPWMPQRSACAVRTVAMDFKAVCFNYFKWLHDFLLK